jgi:hypothetical protein
VNNNVFKTPRRNYCNNFQSKLERLRNSHEPSDGFFAVRTVWLMAYMAGDILPIFPSVTCHVTIPDHGAIPGPSGPITWPIDIHSIPICFFDSHHFPDDPVTCSTYLCYARLCSDLIASRTSGRVVDYLTISFSFVYHYK